MLNFTAIEVLYVSSDINTGIVYAYHGYKNIIGGR